MSFERPASATVAACLGERCRHGFPKTARAACHERHFAIEPKPINYTLLRHPDLTISKTLRR